MPEKRGPPTSDSRCRVRLSYNGISAIYRFEQIGLQQLLPEDGVLDRSLPGNCRFLGGFGGFGGGVSFRLRGSLGGFCRGDLLRIQPVLGVHHHAQYKENAERDQNKVQNGLYPCSPQDSNLGNRFDTLGGFHALAEHGLDII